MTMMAMTTTTDEQCVDVSTPFLDIPTPFLDIYSRSAYTGALHFVYTNMLHSVPMMENSTAEEDDQAWFWTTEWQEGEQEATLEIQRGQLSKPLHSVDEIRQYLSEL